MRNLVLNSKYASGFITDKKLIAGSNPSEHSRLKLKLADGSKDYIPNATVTKEKINLKFFDGITRKQALDAVKCKNVYQERANISKSIAFLLSTMAIATDLLFASSVFVQPIQDFLMGSAALENIIGILAIAAVSLTVPAAASLLVLNGKNKDLAEVEEFEAFFKNEDLINKYQQEHATHIGLSKGRKNALRKVVDVKTINIDSLHILGKQGLYMLIAQMKEYDRALNDPSFEFFGDTIGIPNLDEEKPAPRALKLEPKKEKGFFRRLFS